MPGACQMLMQKQLSVSSLGNAKDADWSLDSELRGLEIWTGGTWTRQGY